MRYRNHMSSLNAMVLLTLGLQRKDLFVVHITRRRVFVFFFWSVGHKKGFLVFLFAPKKSDMSRLTDWSSVKKMYDGWMVGCGIKNGGWEFGNTTLPPMIMEVNNGSLQ